jgi:hypothetical protein
VFLSPSTTLVFIIIRKHRDIIDADEQACEGANLKELLALSNPYRCVELVGRGCIRLHYSQDVIVVNIFSYRAIRLVQL